MEDEKKEVITLMCGSRSGGFFYMFTDFAENDVESRWIEKHI